MIRVGTGRSRGFTARRLGTVLLVTVGAAVTLTACGVPLIPTLDPTDTPTALPSAAPVPTPTPTPTPTPSSVPSPEPTGGPGSPGSPGEPGAPSACTTDRLSFALQERPGDSGAGSFFWDLSVTNSGAVACTATGYPRVQLVSADTGQPIGAASGLEPRTAPSAVLLQPGDSAFSLLHLTRAGVYGCPLIPVTELAVTPPNTDQSSRVATPNPIDGCADPAIQLARTGAFAASPVVF
ncbi:DUF4232 domain-containing protein [Cryobacterium sp. TMT4-31]|uniref:DUF4232 domain-containing protein n=1 Tax=Cryobacterium sp. TMT4-31 TaxID=1259259 RepID=UPI00106DBB85|nr:DUF4232 domain-containing protein [Cryobacterium sp. TMT4-31]TFC89275.1 DUF4232 domain-containing protein [Cryobacterium sp. TMT4-31]